MGFFARLTSGVRSIFRPRSHGLNHPVKVAKVRQASNATMQTNDSRRGSTGAPTGSYSRAYQRSVVSEAAKLKSKSESESESASASASASASELATASTATATKLSGPSGAIDLSLYKSSQNPLAGNVDPSSRRASVSSTSSVSSTGSLSRHGKFVLKGCLSSQLQSIHVGPDGKVAFGNSDEQARGLFERKGSNGSIKDQLAAHLKECGINTKNNGAGAGPSSSLQSLLGQFVDSQYQPIYDNPEGDGSHTAQAAFLSLPASPSSSRRSSLKSAPRPSTPPPPPPPTPPSSRRSSLKSAPRPSTPPPPTPPSSRRSSLKSAPRPSSPPPPTPPSSRRSSLKSAPPPPPPSSRRLSLKSAPPPPPPTSAKPTPPPTSTKPTPPPTSAKPTVLMQSIPNPLRRGSVTRPSPGAVNLTPLERPSPVQVHSALMAALMAKIPGPKSTQAAESRNQITLNGLGVEQKTDPRNEYQP